MQVPEVRRKLVAQGLYPVRMCGADFAGPLRNNMTTSAVSFATRTSKRS